VSESLLLPDGVILINPSQAADLWEAIDLLLTKRRSAKFQLRPELVALRDQCRHTAAVHSATVPGSVGGPSRRTSAEQPRGWSYSREDGLLTAEQIAEQLHYTPHYIRRLMRRHEISSRSVKPYRWSDYDVALLQQRREETRHR